jgi:hypothetical protein
LVEIQRGLAVERAQKESQEARRLEEIRLKEEVELKVVQDE